LLEVTPSGRYEIHELLRQYAAEKLYASRDAATSARDRHGTYYMAALQRWGTDLTSARWEAASVELEAELGNIGALCANMNDTTLLNNLG
jgi:hypothetical protein